MTRLPVRRLSHRSGPRYRLGLAAVLLVVPVGVLVQAPDAWPYLLGYGVLLLGVLAWWAAGPVEVVVEAEDVALLQRQGLRTAQVRLRRAPEVWLQGRRDGDVARVELSVRGPDKRSVTLPLLRLGAAPAAQSPELLRALADGLSRSVRRRSLEASLVLRAQAEHTGPLETSPLAGLLPPPRPAGGGGSWADVLDLLPWVP